MVVWFVSVVEESVVWVGAGIPLLASLASPFAGEGG